MGEDTKVPWSIRDLTVSAPRMRSSLVLRVHAPVAATHDALGDAFHCAWPVEPNTASGVTPRILWLSPVDWLLVGGETARVQGILDRALHGQLHHVSDVTAGRVTFTLAGARARTLLARGCSLDLHPRVFPPGRCAQTLFAQIPALIERVDGFDGFELTVDVTYQDYLVEWISTMLTLAEA